jgi:hypothetical protein
LCLNLPKWWVPLPVVSSVIKQDILIFTAKVAQTLVSWHILTSWASNSLPLRTTQLQ